MPPLGIWGAAGENFSAAKVSLRARAVGWLETEVVDWGLGVGYAGERAAHRFFLDLEFSRWRVNRRA